MNNTNNTSNTNADILLFVSILPKELIYIIGEYSIEVEEVKLILKINDYKKYIEKYSQKVFQWAKNQTKQKLVRFMYASFIKPVNTVLISNIIVPTKMDGDRYKMFYFWNQIQHRKKDHIHSLAKLLDINTIDTEETETTTLTSTPNQVVDYDKNAYLSMFYDMNKSFSQENQKETQKEKEIFIPYKFSLVARIHKQMLLEKENKKAYKHNKVKRETHKTCDRQLFNCIAKSFS